jgi:hypothetical protein
MSGTGQPCDVFPNGMGDGSDPSAGAAGAEPLENVIKHIKEGQGGAKIFDLTYDELFSNYFPYIPAHDVNLLPDNRSPANTFCRKCITGLPGEPDPPSPGMACFPTGEWLWIANGIFREDAWCAGGTPSKLLKAKEGYKQWARLSTAQMKSEISHTLSDAWFEGEGKVPPALRGKGIVLPDPLDPSKDQTFLLSFGHGVAGGGCGDIALLRANVGAQGCVANSPVGQAAAANGENWHYLIHMQADVRTWSGALSAPANRYINRFDVTGAAPGGVIQMIPVTGNHTNGTPVNMSLTEMYNPLDAEGLVKEEFADRLVDVIVPDGCWPMYQLSE